MGKKIIGENTIYLKAIHTRAISPNNMYKNPKFIGYANPYLNTSISI